MGQKLREDKIGAISHLAGVITLEASSLTIGGQQFKTSTLTRTITTDVTLTANTMYMVYAVQSGGVVSLKISTNVNSVGPAGFVSWKLVGAFNTNFSSTFQTICQIETPLIINVHTINGAFVTIDASVWGVVPFSANSDIYGLIRPESGSYTSSTGNYGTRNPDIFMPLDGQVSFDTTVNWLTGGVSNFTNTWQVGYQLNGVGLTGDVATNAWGANSLSVLSFMKCANQLHASVSKGDYISVRTFQDAISATNSRILSLLVTFKANKAIKDL